MKNQSVNPIDFALKTPDDRHLTPIILFAVAEVTKASPFQVAEYIPYTSTTPNHSNVLSY